MASPHEQETGGSETINPTVILAVFALLALFGPVAFSVYQFSHSDITWSIISMTWMLSSYGSISIDPNFMVMNLLASLPFTFLRPIFVYQIYRCYQGKTSVKRTVIAAIASEMPISVMAVIFYISAIMNPYYGGIQIVGPFPVLAIVGIIALKLSPPPRDRMWVESEEAPYWWEEDKTQPPEPVETVKTKAQAKEEQDSFFDNREEPW